MLVGLLGRDNLGEGLSSGEQTLMRLLDLPSRRQGAATQLLLKLVIDPCAKDVTQELVTLVRRGT